MKVRNNISSDVQFEKIGYRPEVIFFFSFYKLNEALYLHLYTLIISITIYILNKHTSSCRSLNVKLSNSECFCFSL